MIEHVITAMSSIGLGLMFAHWEWDKWGGRARRAVPGSLFHAEALRRRRIWRWPGFLFWPFAAPGWVSQFSESVLSGSGWAVLWGVLLIACAFSFRLDLQKLRRELEEEDEDDWFNKGKRLGKRLWKAARSVRIAPVRLPAPAPAGI